MAKIPIQLPRYLVNKQKAGAIVDFSNYIKAHTSEFQNGEEIVLRYKGEDNQTIVASNIVIDDVSEGLFSFIGGGDAGSVNGYKIKALFPSQYNQETADENTIYFIFKVGSSNVPAIPETADIYHTPGSNGYMPTATTGWGFVTQPERITVAGTYNYEIKLTTGVYWGDGTKTNKIYTINYHSYEIQMPSSLAFESNVGEITAAKIIQKAGLTSVLHGVSFSIRVISGNQGLNTPGNYILELYNITDPGCTFQNGQTTKRITVTVGQNAGNGWVFGDSFPITFGEGSEESQVFAFGGPFPIVFS